MKAYLNIKGKKPNKVDITGISFRPHIGKIVLYLEGHNTGFEYTPEEFHSIIIGDNGKATITPIDLHVISEIYAVINWLNELELPVFQFDIN